MKQAVGEAIRRSWEVAVDLATITTGDPRARRFFAFGENTSIRFPAAALHGLDRIAIGSYSMVGPYSTLSAGDPFDLPSTEAATEAMLIIGEGCLLGRNSTVVAHRRIVIEDSVWMGDGVFISDQNHDWADPDQPIGAQAQPPRPVRIGAASWIGHGAMILAGSEIGCRVVVAAGAVVTGAVPDHSIVAGIPARVIGSTQSGPLPSAGTGA